MRRVLAHAHALAALAFVMAVAPAASAHGVRTGALHVIASSPTHALARWSAPGGASAEPVMPADCTSRREEDLSAGAAQVHTVDCLDGLAGRTFAVRGLGPLLPEATLFVRFADGREASRLLTAEEPAWELPRTLDTLATARSYVRAGLVHIATGADHLLFLALLVLVLRRARAVLLAETAFTVSHSVAFSATALGWVHLRPAPVEACIALSLVLLALDAQRDVPQRAGYGAVTALVFGLVHGLGFAGGLREAGLPDAHAAVALLGFGLGVELGQVAFLGFVLLVVAAASRVRAFPKLVAGATVAAGGVAASWLLERVLQCVT